MIKWGWYYVTDWLPSTLHILGTLAGSVLCWKRGNSEKSRRCWMRARENEGFTRQHLLTWFSWVGVHVAVMWDEVYDHPVVCLYFPFSLNKPLPMVGTRSGAGGAFAPPLFWRNGVKVCNEPATFHCCCAFPGSDQLQSSVGTDAGQCQSELYYEH